jgi:hypothetical protein
MALGLSLIVLTAGGAGAREQQLAGMRLGQHAINLLDVYGQPDGIVVGQGPEFGAASAAQMPGGAPGMGGPGGPTPAMFGPPSAGMMGGAGAPPPPGMAGPAGGAMPGPGNFGPGVPGAPGMPGAPGAAGGAAAAVQASPFPEWALAVWVEMKPGQVEWIYNKGPVVLGFVLDRDGYIDSIALVGEDCNYARTAMWRPHQYVKLGDDFKRVMYRYGYPDESITFESTGPGDAAPGQGSVTVTFAGNSHVFSHDVIVRYTETNNVAFTLHDLKVTRIQIWR